MSDYRYLVPRYNPKICKNGCGRMVLEGWNLDKDEKEYFDFANDDAPKKIHVCELDMRFVKNAIEQYDK